MEKKEWISVIVAIVLSALLLMFSDNSLKFNVFYLIIPAIIISVSIISQKITANYIDASIEIRIWEMKRWWITQRSYLKKAVPMGVVLPLLLGFLSGGFIKMLTFLQFTATALPSKVAKKYGTRRIPGILEWDDALISFYGILAVMTVAIISSFFSSAIFPFKDLAKYSLYYIIWNLIPFSHLSGSRLFYGSYPLYIFTLVITFFAGMIVLY